MSDGLYEIFAVEQKRLADEARARGDAKAQSIHERQATRFWELQRKALHAQSDAALAEQERRFEAEMPEVKTVFERKREAMLDMIHLVHIHQHGTIICHGRVFSQGENGIKAVRMRPEMDTELFRKHYLRTNFYRNTRTPMCPQCLVEDEMIKTGVIPMK